MWYKTLWVCLTVLEYIGIEYIVWTPQKDYKKVQYEQMGASISLDLPSWRFYGNFFWNLTIPREGSPKKKEEIVRCLVVVFL